MTRRAQPSLQGYRFAHGENTRRPMAGRLRRDMRALFLPHRGQRLKYPRTKDVPAGKFFPANAILAPALKVPEATL